MTDRFFSFCSAKLSVANSCCAKFPPFFFSFFSWAVFFILFAPQAAYSQTSSSLINSRASAKALTKSTDARSSGRGRLAPSYRNSGESLGESLRLDTVDDIIWTSKRDKMLINEYRGFMYLTYLRDVVGLEQFDDLEDASVAERLLLFQTAKTLSDVLMESHLEQFYRRVARSMKQLREYTSFNLVEDRKGSVGFHQGEKKGRKLLEFKLHASARNGIEPRLKIDDDLVLRYDPLHADTMLEYNYDF